MYSRVQLAPAANANGVEAEQVPPLRANGAAAAVNAVTSSDPVPVLDKVTACAALVVPMRTLPKSTTAGAIARTPWVPLPLSAIVPLPVVFAVTVNVWFAAPVAAGAKV